MPSFFEKLTGANFSDESESKKMGERGRDVVEKKYNWAAEFEKMISLYSRL